MLVRSWVSRPPSKRSRSKRVRRSPRKPAYTVAAAIAPMIPPHRAAATSTVPPRLARCRPAVYLRLGGGGGLVDAGDLGGHHRPGVAAGGGAGGLSHRRPAGRVVEQAGQGGGERLRVAGGDQQPLAAVADHVAVAAD